MERKKRYVQEKYWLAHKRMANLEGVLAQEKRMQKLYDHVFVNEVFDG